MSYELFDVLRMVVEVLLVLLALVIGQWLGQRSTKAKKVEKHSRFLSGNIVRPFSRLSLRREGLEIEFPLDPRKRPYYEFAEQHLKNNYRAIWNPWIDVVEQYERIEKKERGKGKKKER